MQEKNTLVLKEIDQLHSVIKDFSNQSTSIKKISITIYITFLSIYYGAGNVIQMDDFLFGFIGILIPFFCYVYEVYIDIIRQKLRIQMQNKIVSYQKQNNFSKNNTYKDGMLAYKIIVFKFIIYKKKIFLKFKKFEHESDKQEVFFINLLHPMYIIYLIEILGVIIVEVVN